MRWYSGKRPLFFQSNPFAEERKFIQLDLLECHDDTAPFAMLIASQKPLIEYIFCGGNSIMTNPFRKHDSRSPLAFFLLL